MSIEFPQPYCDIDKTQSHWYTEILPGIWRCKFCWASKALPRNWDDLVKFSNERDRVGVQAAYRRFLSTRPNSVKILEKLDEIRLLRELMPEKELVRIVAVIIKDNQPPPAPVSRPVLDYYAGRPSGKMSVTART